MMDAWQSGLRWPAVAAGCLLAIVLWNGVGRLLEQVEPVRVSVNSVELTKTDGAADNLLLQVRFTAPLPKECIRFSQYALYREGTAEEINYIPAGSSVTGSGLARAGRLVPVHAIIELPAALPSGDYQFVHRSYLSCAWIGGLFYRQFTSESAPVRLTVR